jgi:hypothetical protein
MRHKKSSRNASPHEKPNFAKAELTIPKKRNETAIDSRSSNTIVKTIVNGL